MTAAAALVLAVIAWPALLARAAGGRAPTPGPQLAALAPAAALPAIAAAILAATVSWRLAVLLAIPAAVLAAWQLPRRRPRGLAAGPPATPARPGTLTLRVLTLNVLLGSADPAALLMALRRYEPDVLAMPELTPELARLLADAGIASLLPFSLLDPRPRYAGMGLWSRWPLTPIAPVPGLSLASARARICPPGGWPVTVAAVHPVAPVKGGQRDWQRELERLGSALAGTGGPQVVAGDFNASRDHRPFRNLLAAGFLDCADAAGSRPWPGFTWPADRPCPAVMRLDHVLVSQAGAHVREARMVRMPRTDHLGVLAVIELQRPG